MDTTSFTFDEMNLMCIYNTRTWRSLIYELWEMRGYLEIDETELLTLIVPTLSKLEAASDVDFDEFDLVPDFDQ